MIRYEGGFHFISNSSFPKRESTGVHIIRKTFLNFSNCQSEFLFHCELLLETAWVLGRRELTEDGENDHEEEQQQEDVHEGWQGLEDLPEVAGEEDRAGAGGGEVPAGQGPRSAVWASSVGCAFVKTGAWRA